MSATKEHAPNIEPIADDIATMYAFFTVLPNVSGQTCGPCAIALMGSVNRIVCSRWLGSVVFDLSSVGFMRVVEYSHL